MTLLEDIQNTLVDASSDLGTVLRKCRLLAARLGSQPLEDWLIWESNGYPENVDVPGYRIWSLQVKGHFFGSFGSEIRNVPIPTACLPEETQKSYEQYKCRDSIARIEAVLKESDKAMVYVTTSDESVPGAFTRWQGGLRFANQERRCVGAAPGQLD